MNLEGRVREVVSSTPLTKKYEQLTLLIKKRNTEKRYTLTKR